MSFKSAKESLAKDLAEIKEAGLWKTERVIASEQKNDITLADGSEVINMCANNYLGLANNPEVIKAITRVREMSPDAVVACGKEVGIDLRPEALRFAGEILDCSKYLKDRCHVFEVEFSQEPVVTIDRREVVAAAFRTPEEALAGNLAPIVRTYLTQRLAGRARAVTD